MKNHKLQLKIKLSMLHAPPIHPFSCSSMSLWFIHLYHFERVALHTTGLHSTLMVSQDKQLSLSVISKLLLLFSFFLSFTKNELALPEAI